LPVGKLRLRAVAAGDAARLAARMRPGDIAEVEAATGSDPERAVRLGIAESDPAFLLAADFDGELGAVFGVAPVSLATGSGSIWMLGTTVMDGNGRSLGLVARRYVEEALQAYPVLFNYVDARNAPSLRLIRWLGFEIAPARPFGARGLPFHRFELRSKRQICALSTRATQAARAARATLQALPTLAGVRRQP
jgi:hypothetical protein